MPGADSPEPKTKMARVSETQDALGEREADVAEPKAPVARTSVRQVEENEVELV